MDPPEEAHRVLSRKTTTGLLRDRLGGHMPVLWVTIVVLLRFLNISMLSCKGKVDFGILTP